MTNSYANIVTFLLTTLCYYMALKPTIHYAEYVNKDTYKTYVSNHYLYLAIYLVLVMVIQFVVNSSIIASTCGGSISENMGAAGVFTFIPWILIFGIIIVVLIVYPGFKSAFADVIGYFYVSSAANALLTELLMNRDVEKALGPEAGADAKEKMQDAADLIVKICGNMSVLINQIVPSNFDNYWNLLTPLKKLKYQNDGDAITSELKTKLFDLVVTRDTIGEAMWFIYTGLLITSIVQLKITTRGCASNPKTMEQNYQKFVSAQEEADSKHEQATSTTYTITN